ncbi:MAG: Aminopeptidase YwaD precursor [candidate division BRC1 bacterium ADurb.BinA364]|nr:MAG: Aminopeptidase YwaD precursor [candidate division BRC1 bacterium ADurb.BinA364]
MRMDVWRQARAAVAAIAMAWAAVAAAQDAPLLFDGGRAMAHLQAQCAFGPRVPGTRAHEQAARYFVEQFQALGLQPLEQRFTARPALLNRRETRMVNILARLGEDGAPSVAITAHWDSRPIAEFDPSPSLRSTPISGANDGASGAAVVLELARVFSDRPTTVGLLFALVDGEDLGTTTWPKEYCLGSKYLAPRLKPEWNVRLAINLDMVGDRNLHYTLERYGAQASPDFHAFCWGIGREIAPAAFTGRDERGIFDDHVIFLRAGIPAFNLIDFDYPYWHTQDDTPMRCSAESLETSGKVAESIVRRLETVPWDFSVGSLPPETDRY